MNIKELIGDENEWEECDYKEWCLTDNNNSLRIPNKEGKDAFFKRKEKPKFPKTFEGKYRFFRLIKYENNDDKVTFNIYNGHNNVKFVEFYEEDIPALKEAIKYWEDNK